MDFSPRTPFWLVGRQCEVCDSAIEESHGVRYDTELSGSGDDERLVTRVQHPWCWDYVQEFTAKAVQRAIDAQAEAIWDEAMQLVVNNSHEDALVALQFRHDRAARRLRGDSGARLEAVLRETA